MGGKTKLVIGWTVAVALTLCCPLDVRADAGAEAAVLHAEALVAEMDGDPASSLDSLRQAIALAPDDIAVAFDLARIALETSDDSSDETSNEPSEQLLASDLEPFVKLTPETAEERKLRAYILARREDLAGAAAEIAAAQSSGDADAAGDAELADLREDLAAYLDALAAAQPAKLELRLMVGTEGDSNITLESGATPSRAGGLRLVVDGTIASSPFDSIPGLQGALSFNVGTHLTGRNSTAALGAYDTATAMGRISFATDLGPLETYVEANGTFVAADTFRADFMHELGGYAEVRWPLAIIPALYIDAGFRDFVSGNNEFDPSLQRPANAPTTPQEAVTAFTAEEAYERARDDRDGPRIAVGALAEWPHDIWALALRVGFQTDLAEGEYQAQRGLDAALMFNLSYGGFATTVGFTFEWRRHPMWEVASLQPIRINNPGRTDIRLMPQVDASYAVFDWLAVKASYVFVRNQSNGGLRVIDIADGTSEFSYSRHILGLGLEGSY